MPGSDLNGAPMSDNSPMRGSTKLTAGQRSRLAVVEELGHRCVVAECLRMIDGITAVIGMSLK